VNSLDKDRAVANRSSDTTSYIPIAIKNLVLAAAQARGFIHAIGDVACCARAFYGVALCSIWKCYGA
jgi:hypothetical protein